MANKSMETIVSLAKHRGFVFPGSEIYGGLANTWDYGPLGVELKTMLKSVVAKVCPRIRAQCWNRCCHFNEPKSLGCFWSRWQL